MKITGYEGIRVSINQLADAFYQSSLTPQQIQLFLSLPIDIRSRRGYEAKSNP